MPCARKKWISKEVENYCHLNVTPVSSVIERKRKPIQLGKGHIELVILCPMTMQMRPLQRSVMTNFLKWTHHCR
ncbi:unnamed protein product [Larinioides sclopetarius]|uniref:Uncharacterized protein n=1 Tax=Larinioides sclopetarius TaxID=280406 RepID=A0AAV2AFF6_9ARAC